jgi:hypothetical protein
VDHRQLVWKAELEPERVYERFHELLADAVPHDGRIVSSYDERDDLIHAEYA